MHLESPSVRTPVCTPHTASDAPLQVQATVNVNDLRLGFSDTTRNPEGILSHSADVTTTDPCVVHAPNGHLAPTLSQSLKKRKRTYAWLLVHPPLLALLNPAPCVVYLFLPSGHQPPEITPDTRLSLYIRPLHLSFSPPQPFTVHVGETLSNLRARVARKLGVAAVQLQRSGGPLPQFGTVQSTSLTTSHLLYYEVRSACGVPMLHERDASNHRSPYLPEPNNRVLTHVAGD